MPINVIDPAVGGASQTTTQSARAKGSTHAKRSNKRSSRKGKRY